VNSPHPPPGIFIPDLISPHRTVGARSFTFNHQVAVMAIVNRTPDSFYDNGATYDLEAAVAAALTAVEDGADWVDIGGVPMGPHKPAVSQAEELDRIIPVIEAIDARSDVVISVDTYRTEVARRAIAAGANVINDVSGLYDPELADLVAATGTTLVIMHSLAKPPRTPVLRPSYGDVVDEVAQFLTERAELAMARGVNPDQIIFDPGFDVNKNTHHSLALARRLSEITRLGYPTLVAVSNKHFIGETLDVGKDDRRAGNVAALTVCITQGARIIRVHDVRSGVHTARITEAILGWRGPAVARHNLV